MENKLKYWLCRKCVVPVHVGVVTKSSFAYSPMGKCEKCDNYWKVPSDLYNEVNRVLGNDWADLHSAYKERFKSDMTKAKKLGKERMDIEWKIGKDFWVAIMLCERTEKMDKDIGKMLMGG